MHQQQTAFRNEQFLLFPQCFLLNQIIVSPLVHIFDIISLFGSELEEPQIGILGKGLNYVYPGQVLLIFSKLSGAILSNDMISECRPVYDFYALASIDWGHIETLTLARNF